MLVDPSEHYRRKAQTLHEIRLTMRVSDQSFHHKHVISADGHVVGTVHAVYIDSAELRIDCLAVALRKEVAERLGFAHSVFHKSLVEISGRDIQSVADTVVLAVPLDVLRRAPPMQPQRGPVMPAPAP
jgi:sporulation protein YlmC with PRC-barrel domain